MNSLSQSPSAPRAARKNAIETKTTTTTLASLALLLRLDPIVVNGATGAIPETDIDVAMTTEGHVDLLGLGHVLAPQLEEGIVPVVEAAPRSMTTVADALFPPQDLAQPLPDVDIANHHDRGQDVEHLTEESSILLRAS